MRWRRLFVLSCLIANPVLGQQIAFDTASEAKAESGYQIEWEQVQQRLIFYRDTDNPELAAVRAIDYSGKSVVLHPLGDFSGSTYIDVWDAKGAPNGDIIVAAILAYGPRKSAGIPVKSLLLTYDANGTLRKVWEVKPYHIHHVAVDSQGNIFALGDRGKSNTGYPLLIKYSPDGSVLKETLSSSLFADGELVIGSNSSKGECQMLIRNNRLFVYIAETQEVFVFSLDGDLQFRIPLENSIRRIAEMTGDLSARLFEISIDRNQELIAQVRLYPQDRKSPSRLALARITADGTVKSLTKPIFGRDEKRFLGLTNDDIPVYLEASKTGAPMVDLSKRPELP